MEGEEPWSASGAGAGLTLEGNWLPRSSGIVLFATARGSRQARVIVLAGYQPGGRLTLLSISTSDESVDMRTAQLRFDIGLLRPAARRGHRLAHGAPEHDTFGSAYFGAAARAAPLRGAAAERPDWWAPSSSAAGSDLAGPPCRAFRGTDLAHRRGTLPVIELNRAALAQLRGESSRNLPGRRLFRKPGALAKSAAGTRWFERHLKHQARAPVR